LTKTNRLHSTAETKDRMGADNRGAERLVQEPKVPYEEPNSAAH
jgi:hypothetical protein